MRLRRTHRSLLLAGLAATLAACGSTVQQTAGSAGGALSAPTDGSGFGAAAPPVGPTSGGAVTAGQPAGGTPSVGGSASAGGADAGSVPNGTAGSGGSGTTGGGAVAVQGAGITATTISVGIPYTSNGDAYNAALGAAVKNGDPRADWQAVIEDINSSGGIAGRKLAPVWYAYDANSTNPYASQDQAACAAFTEDHHVFAVLGYGKSDTLEACLKKAGVLQISAVNVMGPDKRIFASLPLYFDSAISQERLMGDEVGALSRGGYFSKWDYNTGQPGAMPVKLGILSVDVPMWERPLESTLLPGLARAGHPVAAADIIRVHNPSSAAEDGQTVNDIQSAVLKFRSDNVTHVILLDSSGSLTLLFAKPAQSQHYLPRFGINSGTGAQALADSGNLGNDQLNGAVGLGWVPAIDVPAAAGQKYLTAAAGRCLKVMKEGTGNDYSGTSAATAFGICDMGSLLSAGVKGAGASITNVSVRRSLEALGTSFVPAALPEVFFGATRHDGTQRGFDMHWDTSCTCAKYSGQHEIP